MNRTTHNLAQGGDAWHQHRQSHFNASDAPAMMGASRHRSRADLLREKATGISPEVAEATQRLFDAGHAAEAAIRPVIELAISDELYAVTMSVYIDGLRLSASLDGLNFDGDTVLEVKLWNEELAEQVRAGELDPHYYWQLEQQLLCSGATRVIFATGDGAEKLATMEYRAVPGRADALIAGWRQFAADLASYSHVEKQERQATGRTPETLPALRIEARGMVTSSNLAEYKAHALAVLGNINRDLQTDDDFADAEATGDYAVLVAALLPCFWIYADVGKSLATRNRPGHPYADWLATYADEAFAAATRRAIEITEGAVQRADASSRRAAARAFRASCVHEKEFFAAPLR